MNSICYLNTIRVQKSTHHSCCWICTNLSEYYQVYMHVCICGKGSKMSMYYCTGKVATKTRHFLTNTQKLLNNKHIIKDICIYSCKDAAVIINCFCLPSLEHFSSTKSWAPLTVRNLHDCKNEDSYLGNINNKSMVNKTYTYILNLYYTT